mgnify:CR=1 FL=1
MCLGAATGILTAQVGEIESIDDFLDEACQMILGEPVSFTTAAVNAPNAC